MFNYHVQLPWVAAMGYCYGRSCWLWTARDGRQYQPRTPVLLFRLPAACQKPGLVAPSPRQWYLEIPRFEIPGSLLKPEKMQADSPGEDAIALELSHPKPQPGCPSGLLFSRWRMLREVCLCERLALPGGFDSLAICPRRRGHQIATLGEDDRIYNVKTRVTHASFSPQRESRTRYLHSPD